MENLTDLELYKQIPRKYKFMTIYRFVCYSSIDAYISNPTDQVYEVITEKCIAAYLKVDNSESLEDIANCVSEKYSNNELTLEKLEKMSSWDIIELLY